ncbi:MAG: hypothetical protein MZV63_66160 [Marinilabiliales bacterium]|nr:hypothetical protein [Marinilabiliales bacterium]
MRAEGGDEREGDEERGGHGRGDDDGQRQVVDLELALEEGEAEEDGHGRQGRGQDGDEDLPGPADGGLPRRHPALPQAQDVLEDDDGIVDEHAEAEGERPEGQHVERDPEGVDEVEGDDDGEGDGGQDEERRLDAPQDDEDHDEDDGRDQPGQEIEVVEVLADLLALVVDALEVEAGRELALDRLELGLDVAGDAQGVRPALLGHGQADRGPAVDAVDLPDVGVGQLDPGHVADQDGVRARVGDDRVAQLVEAVDAVGELEEELPVAAPDPSRRIGPQAGADRGVDRVGMEAEGLDPVLVERDPDLGLRAAGDLDPGDAPDRAQADLELLLDQLLELLQAVIPRDRVLEEGPDPEILRDVGLEHGPDARREDGPRLGQLLAQDELGEFHVRLGIELQGDPRHPDLRGRGHLGDALDRGAGLLDRGRHLCLDDFGRHAVPARDDVHHREAFLRRQLDRRVQERVDPGRQQGQEDHGRGDGAVDEEFHPFRLSTHS